MYDFPCSSPIFSIYYGNNLSFVAEITLPLPDAETVIQDSWDLAFPQVVAWSTAATGILLAILIIRSFIAR